MDFASQVVRLLALSSLPPLVSLVGFTIFGLLVWKVRRFGLRIQQVADAAPAQSGYLSRYHSKAPKDRHELET
jgi:hypothetical protein